MFKEPLRRHTKDDQTDLWRVTRFVNPHSIFSSHLHKMKLRTPDLLLGNVVQETALYIVFDCPVLDRKRFDLDTLWRVEQRGKQEINIRSISP